MESGIGPNAKCRPAPKRSAAWVDQTYRGHHETDAVDPFETFVDASAAAAYEG